MSLRRVEVNHSGAMQEFRGCDEIIRPEQSRSVILSEMTLGSYRTGTVSCIRDRFILLKLDAEKHTEIVSRLRIKGLPTTIILNRAGEHVQTVSGYSRPEALLPV